jgi:hypothetical protein
MLLIELDKDKVKYITQILAFNGRWIKRNH